MNIVIAVDSFKGSMSSLEAGRSCAEGIKRVFPQAEINIRPLADGGEGTVEALTLGLGGTIQEIMVTGPLGKPVLCKYGIISESDTAIIEMAGAAGITLVPDELKNPMNTTTYGVGEVIKDAIAKGCTHFIIGIGGSATNDGGAGMLQALGFGLLDENGNQIKFGAAGLSDLVRITDANVLPQLKNCEFKVACDVTNPLCGELGASAIYGPQKGADASMVLVLDKLLEQYAETAKKTYSSADKEYPGAGAAGGLGFAFKTFLNGSLESGIQIVLQETKLREYIKGADLVITGEGRLDAQTVMGKAPSGVADIAKEYHIPVIAFSGCVTKDAVLCNEKGIDAFFPIVRGACTLEEAMKKENAVRNMADTAEQVFRIIKVLKQENR